MAGVPQAQGLHDLIVITDDWQIVCLTLHDQRRYPVLTVFVIGTHFTTKADRQREAGVSGQPRIMFTVPVIRRFLLFAVAERLTEQTILVTQAIPDRRLIDRGHRVEETGRQTTEPAVAKTRIDFLLQQVTQFTPVFSDHVGHDIGTIQADQVIQRQAADQKLQ